MRIDRIEIHGFGKYRNYSLSLQDGLQVLYGANEAGKTTLLHFILAMLFGMKKSGKKRVIYEENHGRYTPWEGTAYGGVLDCTINEQSYRIERNFIKSKEDCRIFLLPTGEDITYQFPEDARKERLFMQTLFGIDELMFKNGLCLGDTIRSEWDAWRSETAPKLVSGAHLQTTEQAVIQRAESVLLQKLDEIGTERAESKLLGQSISKRQSYKLQIDQETEHEASLQAVIGELEQWEERCSEKFTELTNQKLRVAGSIQAQIERLEREKAQSRAAVEKVTMVLQEQGSTPTKGMRLSAEQFQSQRTELEGKLASFRSDYAEQQNQRNRMQELQTVQAPYQQLVVRYSRLTEQDRLRIDELEQSAASINANVPEDRSSAKLMEWNMPLLVAGGGVLLIAVMLLISVGQLAGIAGFVAGLVLLTMSKVVAMRKQQKADLDRYEKAEKRQAQWEAELVALLDQFDADTPKQARLRWQEIIQARERLAASQEQIDWLQKAVATKKRALHGHLAEIRDLIGDTVKILADVNPPELEQQIRTWEIIAENRLQIDTISRRMEEIFREISKWQTQLHNLGVDPQLIPLVEADFSAEELEDQWRQVQQLELSYWEDRAKRDSLHAKLETLRQGRVRMVDLTREYEFWREQEGKWLRARAAYQVASEVLAEVRQTMYREQAPALVQKVSQLAARFTDGRYTDIRIDSQLEVRVTSPDSGYTSKMESLSKGTIDQLEFALSLAVAESVVPNGGQLPLLIDEPFLHYDDQRLQQALQFLLERGNEGQILLFTHRADDQERLARIAGDRNRFAFLYM